MDSRLAGGPSLFLISPEHTFFLPSVLTFFLLSTHTHKGKHKFSHLSLFLPCLLSVFFFSCRISTSKVQYCSGHLEKRIQCGFTAVNSLWTSPSPSIWILYRDGSVYCKCADLTAPESKSHKQTVQIPSMVLMYSLTSLAGVCLTHHKPYI